MEECLLCNKTIKDLDTDYLILGEHLIGNEYDEEQFYNGKRGGDDYLKKYTDQVIEGLEKGTWPHIELLKDLHETKINNQPITDLQYRKVLLISHIPLDFDLYTRFAEFTLLESYTGSLKSVKQFGKKVFNNENIPFNKYTHLLFGDKWYLKSPLSRKDKQNILAQAEKEHWFIISLKDMRTKLINILPNLTSWFTTPDI